MHGYRYTGSSPTALLVARNKSFTKKITAYPGIRVPAFAECPLGEKPMRPSELRFPLIVKPLLEDASVGIAQASVVENDEDLSERVKFIHEKFRQAAIVEELIEGRELYVGMVGNATVQLLPIIEMTFGEADNGEHRIATYKAKWDEEYRKRKKIKNVFAKGLSDELTAKIGDICTSAFHALWLQDYGRVDLRLTHDDEVYVLEVNPNPFVAFEHEMANAAEKAGMGYDDFIQRIVVEALERDHGYAGGAAGPGGADTGAALPDLRRRAGALLGILLELRPPAGVAGHHEADGGRVLLLRLGGLGPLLVLSLVRARHRGPGVEPRAAQGAEGVQLSSALSLGLRRRRDVSHAILPLVRPSPEVALLGIPERLSALQQRCQRLDGGLSVVRGGRHRARPDPTSAAPSTPALGGGAPQGLELPRAAAARRVRCDPSHAQDHRDRAALRHGQTAARRDLVEHADRADPARAGPLVSLSQLVGHAHGTLPSRLRRGAQGVPRGGLEVGRLRAPRRDHHAAGFRDRLRGHAPTGGLRGNVPVLRRPAWPVAGVVRRVRAQAQGRAGVREISGDTRLHQEPEGVALTRPAAPLQPFGPPIHPTP